MVSNDEKFKKFSENYTKWTDKKLLEFRREQVCYLFAGESGSQDNEERKALIDLVDREFERRYKLRTEIISVIALIISIISLLISILRNF